MLLFHSDARDHRIVLSSIKLKWHWCVANHLTRIELWFSAFWCGNTHTHHINKPFKVFINFFFRLQNWWVVPVIFCCCNKNIIYCYCFNKIVESFFNYIQQIADYEVVDTNCQTLTKHVVTAKAIFAKHIHIHKWLHKFCKHKWASCCNHTSRSLNLALDQWHEENIKEEKNENKIQQQDNIPI